MLSVKPIFFNYKKGVSLYYKISVFKANKIFRYRFKYKMIKKMIVGSTNLLVILDNLFGHLACCVIRTQSHVKYNPLTIRSKAKRFLHCNLTNQQDLYNTFLY